MSATRSYTHGINELDCPFVVALHFERTPMYIICLSKLDRLSFSVPRGIWYSGHGATGSTALELLDSCCVLRAQSGRRTRIPSTSVCWRTGVCVQAGQAQRTVPHLGEI